MRVAIVGAGFSGIAMAIALRREGIEDFTIFERAESLGGVWHHNTRVVNNWPGFMLEYVRATRAVRPKEFREVRPAVAAGDRGEPVLAP
jgi:cation diffusion facilitator CzcD-associated flavoprotein CzcO